MGDDTSALLATLSRDLLRESQALLILSRALNADQAVDAAEALADLLQRGRLRSEARSTLECVLTRLVARFPRGTFDGLCARVGQIEAHTAVSVTSLLMSLAGAWFAFTPEERAARAETMVASVAPWLACPRAVARFEAQVLVAEAPASLIGMGVIGEGLTRYFRENRAANRLAARFKRVHEERFAESVAVGEVARIFERCDLSLLGDLCPRDCNVDAFQVAVRDVFDEYLDELRDDTQTSTRRAAWWSPEIELEMRDRDRRLSTAAAGRRIVQRKPDAFQDFAATGARAHSGRARQPIVVVATLVERVTNLAGLTRTCEVFRARSLVLADASVKTDDAFTTVSVTSEKWVPTVEVPRQELAAYLFRLRRDEGYVIVGLEQSLESVALQDFAWPDHGRVAVVLGCEVGGIPADVLRVLDVALEIPQLGLVRSLNVHVSAALCVWEYTRAMLTVTGGVAASLSSPQAFSPGVGVP